MQIMNLDLQVLFLPREGIRKAFHCLLFVFCHLGLDGLCNFLNYRIYFFQEAMWLMNLIYLRTEKTNFLYFLEITEKHIEEHKHIQEHKKSKLRQSKAGDCLNVYVTVAKCQSSLLLFVIVVYILFCICYNINKKFKGKQKQKQVTRSLYYKTDGDCSATCWSNTEDRFTFVSKNRTHVLTQFIHLQNFRLF